MFICDVCKQQQPVNVHHRRVVLAVREVTYLKPGGSVHLGTEIIKEGSVCPTCPDPTPVVHGSAKSVYHDTRRSKRRVKEERDEQRG
jgi:hypothetical protein